mgnify:CR=1 FL=1
MTGHEWFFYIIVTLGVVIVMMNMFIAVVGKAFDANLENRERGEYKQLCEIVLELETFVILPACKCNGCLCKMRREKL